MPREAGGAAGIGGGTNTSYSNVHYGDEDGKLNPDKQGKITISGKETVVTAQGGTGVGEAARSTVARESVPGILRAITAAAWHMPSPSRTARPCARWAAFMRKRSAMASGQRILPATALR